MAHSYTFALCLSPLAFGEISRHLCVHTTTQCIDYIVLMGSTGNVCWHPPHFFGWDTFPKRLSTMFLCPLRRGICRSNSLQRMHLFSGYLLRHGIGKSIFLISIFTCTVSMFKVWNKTMYILCVIGNFFAQCSFLYCADLIQ